MTIAADYSKTRTPFPNHPHHVVGRGTDHHGLDWGGIAIFHSIQERQEAIQTLQDLGFDYFMKYKDTQGPGLSWGRFQPTRLRPSRRKIVQRPYPHFQDGVIGPIRDVERY